MKKTLRSNYVVQSLIDDEDMSADLASLYPAASKIGDAAASFIDKADTRPSKRKTCTARLPPLSRNASASARTSSRKVPRSADSSAIHSTAGKSSTTNKLAESEKAEAEQAELEETQED